MRWLPGIARPIFRQHRRSALAWGVVYGAFVWVSTYGYAASYPKLSDRVDFARALESNVGVRAIFGPARDLDTVAGFTGWRCGATFALLGASWGLLLATKTMRGDEEDGRSELLYAGPLTRAGGVHQSLVGLFTVWSTLLVIVVASVVLISAIGGYFAIGAGVFFSVVACAGAATGIAIGALSSQLTITRRAASSIAGGFFGVAFLLRAIGETVEGARWVLWLSPVSWLDQTRPLTGSRFGPLLLVAGLVVGCTITAAALGRRRDLGGAILPHRQSADPRTALLGSSLGLSTRLVRPTIIGWGAGLFVAAAVFGTVSGAISDGLASNTGVAALFSRMGSELSARGYVGLTFVLLGQAVGGTAAALVAATRREESTGRLEFLAAAPLARWRWLAGRVATSALTITAIGVLAGVGGWIGVRLSGGRIGFVTMLLAGVNIVSPGVVTLGIGTLVHGVSARLAVAAAYSLVVWSFVVEMIGSVIELPRLLDNSSLIHHLTAAPLVRPDWRTNATMVTIGIAAAMLGAVALQRRDLQAD